MRMDVCIVHSSTSANPLPLVVAHGMGDSCYNPGMKSITKATGNHLGVYARAQTRADIRVQTWARHMAPAPA